MIITLKNKRGQEIGWIDEKNCYRTKRDFNKGQIFLHPKYKNAVAIDKDIIKELIKRKVNKILIKIINFEKRDFYIETTIDFFLKNSESINHDDKEIIINNKRVKTPTFYSEQRRMPMALWNRFIPEQKKFIPEQKKLQICK